MEDGTLPMGFGLVLMQNEAAMKRYDKLTEAEKEKLLIRARNARSKSEMRKIVSELSEWPDAGGVL